MRTEAPLGYRPSGAGEQSRRARKAFVLPLLAAVRIAVATAAVAQPNTSQLPPLPAAADQLPEIVARVNGDPISKRELLNQAQSMRFQAIEAGAGDPAETSGFLNMVLDALIGERLVFMDSDARQVGPTDGEVEERVQAIIATYGGEEGFQQALAAQGIDHAYVRRQVRQALSIDKVMEGEIKPDIRIEEAAVKAYYERYGEGMIVPDTYKLRHILKQLPDGVEARQIAIAELEGLRTRIAEGADFAALAREYSDDARTRDEGGQLPWMVFSGVEKSFEEAVRALKVGELSGVVETRLGLHLLQLQEKQVQRLKTFEEAREEITNILAVRATREAIQERVTNLRSSAKIEILM